MAGAQRHLRLCCNIYSDVRPKADGQKLIGQQNQEVTFTSFQKVKLEHQKNCEKMANDPDHVMLSLHHIIIYHWSHKIWNSIFYLYMMLTVMLFITFKELPHSLNGRALCLECDTMMSLPVSFRWFKRRR